ncbi:MAG: hypothetical protein Q4B00_09795 [Eubacteriales bacterium]|nr:hypothetical protein [Eubacteriales bacterium]
MAGTISDKELRISCSSKLAAEVDNPSSGFSNAAAMARIGGTMYFAKVNSNGKSKILKSTDFKSGTITSSSVFATLDYFVYGMTAKNQILYLTCKDSGNIPYLLKLGLDGTILGKVRLAKTYVGIASYRTDEFILMEYLNRNNPSEFNLVIGSMENLDVNVNKGIHFRVVANEATDYKKANGIYYDRNYGLFILTNHYISDYSSCKNRILLVKAATYAEGGTYHPFAVFQADMDSKKYKQFNFEGITLYNNNMYVFANVIGLTDKSLKDRVVYQPGIKFQKWHADLNKVGNGYFTFNGSVKIGATIPSVNMNGIPVPNVQSMAMDANDTAYCLKCEEYNLYATLHKTPDPESIVPDVIATFGETENTGLYHCNGMTYNPDDNNLYVTYYAFNGAVGDDKKGHVAILTPDGNEIKRLSLTKKQYGIAYYGNNSGESEFIIMNRGRVDPRKIDFNKAVCDGRNMTEQEPFWVDINATKDDVTLQDIYYHRSYGLFIPAYDKNGETKNTSIIYHVAKEDIERVMEGSADRNLTPDFVISVTLDGYYSYEVESMDINKKTKKMIMCGNCHRVKGDSGQDMYHSLNTLTFI